MLQPLPINRAELHQVLSDLIAIPSVNPPGSEKEVAAYIMAYCRDNSIDVEQLPLEKDPARMNVIARISGAGNAKPIIFTGHMDVVPVSDGEAAQWKSDPFTPTEKDGFLYGRGAADMKGGLAAAMVAMAAYRRSGMTPEGDILLIATADEEALMLGSKDLHERGTFADAGTMVVCEPTDLAISYCCKGRTWATITAYGKTAHASMQNGGHNAIHSAQGLMTTLLAHTLPNTPHKHLGNTFWQVTEIEGGIEPAIIPDRCAFTLDARMSLGQTSDDIWANMDACLKAYQKDHPDCKVSVDIIERREPWLTDQDHPLVRAAVAGLDAIGRPVHYGGCLGTTDASVLNKRGVVPIIMGPGGMYEAHHANEKIRVDDVVDAARLYSCIMQHGWS